MALTNVNKDGLGDQSVDLTKLPHGDTNSDGKFLRSNNGADPTWETVDQTTIPVAAETTDTTCHPVFVTSNSGDLPPKVNDDLKFNSNTKLLTSDAFSASNQTTAFSWIGPGSTSSGTDVGYLDGSGIKLSANAAGPCSIRFIGNSANDYVGFSSIGSTLPSGTQIIWKLPTADGSANQVLTTNGSSTLSWGTVAVPASYDDTNVRKDISKLALQIAVDTNRAAYNLTNSFIDQFEDDSGLATQTNCDRTTDEYMTTVIDSWGADTEYKESDLNSTNLVNSNSNSFSPSTLLDGSYAYGQYGMYIINSSGYNKGFYYEVGADSDFGLKTKITGVKWYSIETLARFAYWRIYTAQDGTNYTNIAATGADNSGNSDTTTLTASNADGWNRGNFGTPFQVSNTNAKVLLKFGGYYDNGNQYAGIGEFRLYAQKYTGTTHATGTLISTTSTADSSRTKVSGVILYKDNEGTAALGTDLKVSFSCDNGSNWTALDATSGNYTAGSNFSSGIKTAYIKEVTCTAGTQVKYKVEWANQADGSKETQLHGIGVNY